jgi:hypothetical protein
MIRLDRVERSLIRGGRVGTSLEALGCELVHKIDGRPSDYYPTRPNRIERRVFMRSLYVSGWLQRIARR